jgi:hypothetical protein
MGDHGPQQQDHAGGDSGLANDVAARGEGKILSTTSALAFTSASLFRFLDLREQFVPNVP